MDSFVTDTQALVKFMLGKKVINQRSHKAYQSADKGESTQNYQFEPLSFEILKTAFEIDDIPELHDRLIAATARYLGLPIITNDPVIKKLQIC